MMFPTLDTPSVLIDLDVAKANIRNYQAYCNKHGLNLRPHIKTHKLPLLARYQVEQGAIGITCQKVSEAEAMIAEGGIDDVLITYNILGAHKTQRLRALADKVRLSVVADNVETVRGLSAAFADPSTSLSVLVECNTGADRCGVTAAKEVVALAKEIATSPGLAFAGLMTYPPVAQAKGVTNWLQAAIDALSRAGFATDVVSSGGSPDMWHAHDMPLATEYRIGTYVYNDRSLIARRVCSVEDCALTVLATVVSVPSDQHAIIDAGSKVLTSDLLRLKGYGHVLGRDDLSIDQLSEEHGRLTISRGSIGLSVGDRVRIIPNHACVVSNMLDHVELIEGGKAVGAVQVAARGQVW